MFCRYCGKKLKDEAVICTGCRRPVDTVVAGPEGDGSGPAWSFGMMAGLIAATLFLPPVGIVFGLLGLRHPARRTQGAVLLTVSVFMSLLMLAVMLGL
jgi:hypothetical protein